MSFTFTQTIMPADFPEKQLIEKLFKNQTSERRFKYIRLAAFSGIALAYLGLFAFLQSGRAPDHSESSSTSYVAVVDIAGEIGPSKDASLRNLAPALKAAFDDKDAKAIVLRINSPGGTPVQASLIHDEIQYLKKSHPDAKVVAVGEDMLTSGAYLIAMAADTVVVNRSTMTGSVGVILRNFGFTGLMEKIGVESRTLTAGESKNQLDPFSPANEQDKEQIQDLLTHVHDHFKDIVVESRGARLKAPADQLFTGAFWTGGQAVQLGLADEIGSLRTVMEGTGSTTFRTYAPKMSLLKTLTQSVGTTASKALGLDVGVPSSVELLPATNTLD